MAARTAGCDSAALTASGSAARSGVWAGWVRADLAMVMEGVRAGPPACWMSSAMRGRFFSATNFLVGSSISRRAWPWSMAVRLRLGMMAARAPGFSAARRVTSAQRASGWVAVGGAGVCGGSAAAEDVMYSCVFVSGVLSGSVVFSCVFCSACSGCSVCSVCSARSASVVVFAGGVGGVASASPSGFRLFPAWPSPRRVGSGGAVVRPWRGGGRRIRCAGSWRGGRRGRRRVRGGLRSIGWTAGRPRTVR